MNGKHPVWLEGDGFITESGQYFSEKTVRNTLRAIMEWWESLTPEMRLYLSRVGELAAIDREIEATIFGGDR